MSSIEPDDRSDEIDGGEEVFCGFFVPGRDGTELLDFGEEILNQMARLVDISVDVARQSAVRPGWDDRCFAGSGQGCKDPCIGIECFVGYQHVSLHRWQKSVGTRQIMGLSAGQMEADRVAQRIDQGMDLGTQSATRSPDRFIVAGFFFAPALCWWARTIVLSIIAYSLSASTARC